MKAYYLFVFLALWNSLSAQKVKGLKTDTAAQKALIIKTERERIRSLVAANMPIAQQLHADDFQLITPTGNPLSKEQYLGMIGSKYLQYNWEPGDITVKMYGDDAAVIRYTDKIFQVTVNGNLVNDGRFTHTDLYEKRQGKWQAVWSQASGQNISSLVMNGVTFVKKDYTLTNTQQYDFTSGINAKSYRLFVALPPNYKAASDDTTRYNVLYVLDGNDEWPLVVESHRVLRTAFGGMNNPEGRDFIIVGIGYPVIPYWNTTPYRTSDYTPVQDAGEDSVLTSAFGVNLTTGGAPQFLQVVKNEIIHFVEHNFRTTNDRGIIGHSFGAGFVAYSLFEEPELFSRYGMLSPNFFRDTNFLLNLESRFAKSHAELNKQIFVARGSRETSAITNSSSQMIDSLNRHYYKGLAVQSAVFPDEMHFSVLPAEISRALQSLNYDLRVVQHKN
ncbi:alpha/beta hydrolase-fold protein [Flavisolibacter ginsenosidimutans]|uniref:DUF4440 domain-containing protein n=1 Tax=Flavisolibacter ginsenosidimutans TaxID=661481 RepID=A0A5B8UF72_9BACT|nr:alpha/beta hydrolase-fold protein [Flavisolibacter ginsenosidimutans]QEC55307.1 DUF4440 domain-containing protein [Flavisolibacter ginsenosidimutans]